MLKLYDKYRNEPDNSQFPLYLFYNRIEIKEEDIKTNQPIEREYGLQPYYIKNFYTKTCFPVEKVETRYMPICYRENLDLDSIYNNIISNGGNEDDYNEFLQIYEKLKDYTDFYTLIDKERVNINWLYMDIDPNFNNSYFIKKLLNEYDDILFIFDTFFNLNLEKYDDFIIAIICQMINNNVYNFCGENSKKQLEILRDKLLSDVGIKYYDIVKHILDTFMSTNLELIGGNNLCYLNTALQILNILNIYIYELEDPKGLIKELITVLKHDYNKTDKIRDKLNIIYPKKYIKNIMYDSTETLIDILDYLFELDPDIKKVFTSMKTEIFYDKDGKLIESKDIKEAPTFLISKDSINDEFKFTNDKNEEVTKNTFYTILSSIIFIGNPNPEEEIQKQIILNDDKYVLICSIVRYNDFPHCVLLVDEYVYDDNIVHIATEREYKSIQTFIYYKN